MTGPSPARITWTPARAGSTSLLSGMPSAVPSAHRVSTLGFPIPDSSWERVDLARPARRASSVRERPAALRSRRIAVAMWPISPVGGVPAGEGLPAAALAGVPSAAALAGVPSAAALAGVPSAAALAGVPSAAALPGARRGALPGARRGAALPGAPRAAALLPLLLRRDLPVIYVHLTGLLVRFDEQLLRVFRIVDMSSFWRTLDRSTLRDIALVCLADAVVGASFGAITVSGGLPAWLPVAMSLLIFAGGAQFAAVGVLLAGGSPVAAILAGLVLNTRLFPYGLAIPDVLGGSWLARLAGAHVLTDESVAFALRQPDRARRRAAFWTYGIGLFAIWNLAVMAGVAAGRAIGNTGVIGLDAVFPAVLVALVLR